MPAPISLVELRPQVGAEQIVASLVPPPQFDGATFETYRPDPAHPSQGEALQRMQELVQAWTKWVIGPGEQGEPAGTTSLGYGPMDPGMALEIPLFVTRQDDKRSIALVRILHLLVKLCCIGIYLGCNVVIA